jgi:hypothetical protein
MTPFLSTSLWLGKPFTQIEFRNSVGYNTSKSGICSADFEITSQLRYCTSSPGIILTIESLMASVSWLLGQTKHVWQDIHDSCVLQGNLGTLQTQGWQFCYHQCGLINHRVLLSMKPHAPLLFAQRE